MTHEQLAQVCHEANRAFCSTLGDNSQPSWSDAPSWQKDSAIGGVRFHLKTLSEGGVPNPRDSHESWLRQKRIEGWSYGPVKDPEKKQHPCFVPYEELPVEQQAKDYFFCGIVEAAFRSGVLAVAA